MCEAAALCIQHVAVLICSMVFSTTSSSNWNVPGVTWSIFNVTAAVAQNSAGLYAALRGYSITLCLGQELPQTSSVLSRLGLHGQELMLCVCLASDRPQQERPGGITALPVQELPRICFSASHVILLYIHWECSQEIVGLNVEVLKYIDVTISGIFVCRWNTAYKHWQLFSLQNILNLLEIFRPH